MGDLSPRVRQGAPHAPLLASLGRTEGYRNNQTVNLTGLSALPVLILGPRPKQVTWPPSRARAREVDPYPVNGENQTHLGGRT